MIGTIIGDIVGSIYEFHNIRTKDFLLFGNGCTFTDDTVMALAVAQGLMYAEKIDDEDSLKTALIRSMKILARRYPNPMGGYGNRFRNWVWSSHSIPYNSWGNGSAMRVSPCGFKARTLDEALCLAKISSEITHNHPEAVAGAQVTAACIYLARSGKDKKEIAKYVETTYCPLTVSIDDLRLNYRFTERCKDTVPQAIQAFLEAEDFEDAIRNAISIGGDSDTLAAITGGIAEAYFGIPDDLRNTAIRYLTPDLRSILMEFEKK